MSRWRAFTLVELLVSIAIIAVLVSLLMPMLAGARSQARAAMCATRLSMMGQGFHMYAGDYLGRAMPLAYTKEQIIGTGPTIYWWGMNGESGVDHTRGFLWEYLRSDLKASGLYECPEQPWGSYAPQGEAERPTSTYGYNGYFLSPPHASAWSYSIGHRPWQNIDTLALPQQLFVFADTALSLGDQEPRNTALLDPPWLYMGGHWSRNHSPTTAFRHNGKALVALADGHVASFGLTGGLRSGEIGFIGSVGGENGPHYVPDWREW